MAAEGKGLGRKSSEQRLKDEGAEISAKDTKHERRERRKQERRNYKKREERWKERKARGML